MRAEVELERGYNPELQRCVYLSVIADVTLILKRFELLNEM